MDKDEKKLNNKMPQEKEAVYLSKDSKNDGEEYSLNDDRRVKVLTPGALVAKRFFRNRIAVIGMAILIFMFVFSFIGGIVSPYGQDEFFYRTEAQRKQFAAVTLNTDFRYAIDNPDVYDSAAQAKTMLSIIQKRNNFEYDNKKYTIKNEGEDFYSIYLNGSVVAIAFKDIVNSTSGSDKFSFEFKYNALKAFVDKEDTFKADGKSFRIDENGNILSGDKEIAYVSRYIVKAKMSDIVLTRDFKDKLLTTIEKGEDKFSYTDENLIINEEEEPITQSEDENMGVDSAMGEDSMTSDSMAQGADIEEDTTKKTATAEYDIEYDAQKETWDILQAVDTRTYDSYSEPSATHWLGTDKNGMDMLTRLMYGGRVSLLIGFIVVIIETVLGIILGGIAGYFGGWVDGLIMRMVDIFYCIPSMPIIIILGAAMEAQRVDPTIRMVYLMLILGILGWAAIARLVRGQILTLREQEFMTATEATGIKVSSRIFRHLIPNVIPQLIVNCTMSLGGVIITEATLSFLGLGVKFPFASWGNIINDVNNTFVLTTYWFIWIPAGLLLLLTVLAFNLVGDGLRDAFDPKMKR